MLLISAEFVVLALVLFLTLVTLSFMFFSLAGGLSIFIDIFKELASCFTDFSIFFCFKSLIFVIILIIFFLLVTLDFVLEVGP